VHVVAADIKELAGRRIPALIARGGERLVAGADRGQANNQRKQRQQDSSDQEAEAFLAPHRHINGCAAR
jgi:hypothetical protein